MPGRFFLLLFTLLPLIEIAFFVLVGRTFGLWPTLLGVLVTALLGAAIVRRQGLSLVSEIRRAFGRGQLPARELADAALVGLAGLLLLLPGYFSDLLGLLLLVPAVRTLLYRYFGTRMVAVVRTRQGFPPAPKNRVGRTGSIDLGDDHYRER